MDNPLHVDVRMLNELARSLSLGKILEGKFSAFAIYNFQLLFVVWTCHSKRPREIGCTLLVY